MRTTIGILSLLFLTLAHAETYSTESTITETIEYAPIVMVVNKLAEMAVDVSDQTTSQLQANIERQLTDMTGNLAALTSNAMTEMSFALEDTNQLLLANPSCNPAWNLQEFTLNVSRQLSECTLNLDSTIEAYRVDGQQVLANVQSFVQQMAQLPMLCQGQLMGVALAPLGLNLEDSSTCFMGGMTTINQGLAQAMHSASLLLVRTRTLSRQQVALAEQCSADVVAQVIEYLGTQRANCS